MVVLGIYLCKTVGNAVTASSCLLNWIEIPEKHASKMDYRLPRIQSKATSKNTTRLHMAAANQVGLPGYPIPADDFEATQDRSKRRRVIVKADIRALKPQIIAAQVALRTLMTELQAKNTEVAKIDEHVVLQERLLREVNDQRARVLAGATGAAAQQLLDDA